MVFEPTDMDLMPLFQFSAADLAANRAGKLSETQRQRLQKRQSRSLIMGSVGFVLFAFIATLLIFLGQQNQSVILSFTGVMLTVCNAIFVGMVARYWLRLSADLRAGSVEIISGTLERILQPNRQNNHYVLMIAEKRFSVNKEQFKAFQHERPYRLYQAAHSGILFSAELE
jgi:Na+/proline symporter